MSEHIEQNPTSNDLVKQQLGSQPNLIAAIIAGLIASLIGGGIWAAITVTTEYQIGWMAIGVGFIVGYAVRFAGKGDTPIFGVIGAAFALFGCLLGNYLTLCGFAAVEYSMPFMETLTAYTFQEIVEAMKGSFNPIDLLFYGIALLQGFQCSIIKYEVEEEAPSEK